MSLSESLAGYARAVDADPETIAAELAAEFATATAAIEHTSLPEADRDALARAATPAEPRGAGLVLPWLTGDAAWQHLRATAVPIAEAADRLGLTDSALRRVLGTTTGPGVELLGVKDARGAWRVLAFQLPDGAAAGGEPASPAGRRVQRALPPGMHPVAVQAWWEAPNAALALDGEELTPRGWLAAGLEPDRVVVAARFQDAG